MGTPIIQRSFAAGELAPILHARADTAKYISGLRTCKNFLVRREGGVTTRPGFRFVAGCKDNDPGHRLMRYVSETDGFSVLIEIGQGYFRFFLNGGEINIAAPAAYNNATAYVPGDLVSSGGVNYYCFANTTGNAPPNGAFWFALTGTLYEIPTAYAVADKFKWNQSGNVITITHPSHPPRELVFASLTRWVLRDIVTAPGISAPGGGAGVAGGAGALTYRYKITSSAIDSFEESNASAPIVIAACAKPTTAAPNTLSWTADPLAAEYSVYCDPFGNGSYGFLGTAATNAYNDTGVDPDFDLTPPISRVVFNLPNTYPSTSAVFEQRRFFANTNLVPDSVQGSRIGFPANFGISNPLQDDDAVTFRVAGNNHHAVRYLVALKSGLILMTAGGEWTVRGTNGGPITPSSIAADQETYVGIAANVAPVVVGGNVLYVQARGSIVRELTFTQQAIGLAGKDLTIFATHLLEGHTLVSIDYAQVPDSIVWCVRSDGVLLGLTYIPEQDVWGWHQHTTAASGVIEDVCVVPELTEDVVYVIVKRAINGTVRYIEKLETRQIVNFDQQCFFVDAGLSYSGAPASSVSGLDHLEGQIVAVVGDGVVLFNGDSTAPTAASFKVTAGAIALPKACSNVHVGLPIIADVETLDLDVQGNDIRDKKKRVGSVTLLLDKSGRSFFAGPDATHLTQYKLQAYESNAKADTGQFELNIVTDYNTVGRVLIRQQDPLPLTLIGIVPNVEAGG